MKTPETRDRTRNGSTLGRYDTPRPVPDEAPLEPRLQGAVAREEIVGASGLNVLAGIWLIISPFVLGYGGADARWNPIVFGAIVAVFALARAGGAYRAEWLSWLNMAVGVWLFVSAFWLAHSAQASWNVGIMGVVAFILGGWSAAATDAGRAAAMPRR
jgi:hypothetical protein